MRLNGNNKARKRKTAQIKKTDKETDLAQRRKKKR